MLIPNGVEQGTVAWAATQVIRMHQREPADGPQIIGCRQCRADQCDLLRWAEDLLSTLKVGQPLT